MQITATYSPEDNKIRLYASARLDAETYARVKEAGFKWAPRQELFVAPKWTCAREDLALDLAGEIEPEEMTLAERAQAKADRLEGIAHKRAAQADAFSRAADSIAERFYMGQPILVGHHSERRARKDQERMHAAQDKAVKASNAVGYWLYRASSVEHHANRKNDPKVRARRIKTLLAELRDLQRNLNDAHKSLDLLNRCNTPELIRQFVGSGRASYSLFSKVDTGEVTPEEAKERLQNAYQATIDSPNLQRWINHTLHRLSYEREMLGEVPRYTGEIKPTTIQMFVREHGADKPKATATDYGFSVECDAPLPAHIGDGLTLELSENDWRDLMQSCGYLPPEKKPAKPPILNFAAPDGFVSVVNPWRREEDILPQVEMTKAEYSKIGTDYKGTRLSTCGNFRVRICPNMKAEGPAYSRGWCTVFLTDQKAHDVPDSYKGRDLEAAE